MDRILERISKRNQEKARTVHYFHSGVMCFYFLQDALARIHELSQPISPVPASTDQLLDQIYDILFTDAPHAGKMTLLRSKLASNLEMRAKLTLQLQEKKDQDSAAKKSTVFTNFPQTDVLFVSARVACFIWV